MEKEFKWTEEEIDELSDELIMSGYVPAIGWGHDKVFFVILLDDEEIEVEADSIEEARRIFYKEMEQSSMEGSKY